MPSRCQTVWIQIRPNILTGLIWVQTVCKGYQQATKVDPRANLTMTLSRSRSTRDHHLNKLGRPHIPNATYQVPKSQAFWFWSRFVNGFYHIWAWWRSSWSCDQNILHKFWLTYHKSIKSNHSLFL